MIGFSSKRVEGAQELLRSAALPVRERTRCLLTASDILRGQGEALTIDRSSFFVELYRLLPMLPLASIDLNDDAGPHNEDDDDDDDNSTDAEGTCTHSGVTSISHAISHDVPLMWVTFNKPLFWLAGALSVFLYPSSNPADSFQVKPMCTSQLAAPPPVSHWDRGRRALECWWRSCWSRWW